MEARPRTIKHYIDAKEVDPFARWMESLKRQKIHGIVLVRLRRVVQGNLGDWGPVGEGVHELKIRYGAGYRVYFGLDGNLVVLLTGGNKSTQDRDIATAKGYWEDYNA